MEVDDRPNRPKKTDADLLGHCHHCVFAFKYICISESVQTTGRADGLQHISPNDRGKEHLEKSAQKIRKITFSDKSGEHIYKTGTMNDPDLVNRLEEAGAVFSKPIVQQMGYA